MYKLEKSDLPAIFTDMFRKNNSVHGYPTRQHNYFHIPLTRTVFAKNTFVFTGPIYWNSLLNDIKDSLSLNTFKRKLKKYLISHYQSTTQA